MPPAEPVSGSRLLVADIGGTTARFAIADLETLALSVVPELQTLRRTLIKWRKEILAYFYSGRLTNAAHVT